MPTCGRTAVPLPAARTAVPRAGCRWPDARRPLDARPAKCYATRDDLTADALEREGSCLLIDLHSFPSRALPYEQDHSLARSEICIGTDPFHTPEALTAAAERFFTEAGLETIRNQPFSGALVPGRFYRGDRRVTSVMIEVRRDLYMDERTGDRNAGFRRIEALLADFVAVAASHSSV